MNCRNFSNHFSDGILLQENTTLEFPPFLQPVLESLLLKVDNYLRYGEDKLFNKLQDSYTLADAKEIIVNTKIPTAYFIVLMLCVVLILFALPIVCFVDKHATKSQYCFALETLGLIFSVMWIFVGISIYLPAANVLYASVLEYPDVIRKMVKKVNGSMQGYKVQVDVLDGEIKRLREEIAVDIGSLPKFVAGSVMDFANPNVDIISASFAQIETLLNSDVVSPCAEFNKTMSDYKNGIADLFSGYNFGRQLETAFGRSSQKELSLVVDVVLSNNGVPLTANISRALQGLSAPLLGIDERVEHFQNAIGKQVLLSISGYDFNLLRLVMLFPVIYSGTFILLLVVSVFHGLKHLKEQLRTRTYLGKLDSTISMLNFTLKISTLFLWLMFLLTGIVYLSFWPMAIACRSLADGTVYRKFLDEASLWNNSTWLDNLLKDNLQLGKSSVESLMNACENNETLVSALKINKTLIDHYYSIPISINLTTLEEAFNESMDSLLLVKPEDYNFIINRIEKNRKQPCHSLSEGDIDAYALNLEKVKTIVIATKIYNENLTKKLKGLKYEWSKSLFQSVSSSISCCVKNFENYANAMVNDKIGNCYIIPYTVKQIRSLTCDHLLFVIMALLISISIMSFSMFFASILLFRITNYVRGVVQFYKCSEFSERYSSNQSRSIALCKSNNRA